MTSVNQELPLPREGFARESQVLKVIPFGRSTLWSKSKSGEFPATYKLSARITAWKCEEVWRWIEEQRKTREAA